MAYRMEMKRRACTWPAEESRLRCVIGAVWPTSSPTRLRLLGSQSRMSLSSPPLATTLKEGLYTNADTPSVWTVAVPTTAALATSVILMVVSNELLMRPKSGLPAQLQQKMAELSRVTE